MFLNTCSRLYHPRSLRQFLAGVPAEPTARCTALGHIPEGRPPPASWPLASLTNPSSIPAPLWALTWKGEGGTLPSCTLLSSAKERLLPGGSRPPPTPPAQKVSGSRSRRSSSFTLSSGVQGPRRHPRPNTLTPGPQPPNPASDSLQRWARGTGLPG